MSSPLVEELVLRSLAFELDVAKWDLLPFNRILRTNLGGTLAR